MKQNFCDSPLGCTKVEVAEVKHGFINKVIGFVLVAGLLILIFSNPIIKIQVNGTSMFPTFKDGQTLVGFTLDKNYHVNDVVVAYPSGWKLDQGVCKRILGVPGDKIVIDGHKLTINGVSIDTGIVPDSFQGHPYSEYTLASDEYFLVGDNRAHSLDSRARGPVKASEITAKIIIMH